MTSPACSSGPAAIAASHHPHAAGQAARAVGQASRPGAPVCFLGAIAVPEEETCFWLYQAPSADAVRAAMTAAGLRPERITKAVSVGPRRARPGPAPSTPGTTGPDDLLTAIHPEGEDPCSHSKIRTLTGQLPGA